MNGFTALKETHFCVLFVVTAAGVLPCGSPKELSRTSSIVQFIFYSFLCFIPFFPLAFVQWDALPESAGCLPSIEAFNATVSGLIDHEKLI